MRIRSAAFAGLCLAAVVASACGKTSDGAPVADDVDPPVTSASPTTAASSPSTRAIPDG